MSNERQSPSTPNGLSIVDQIEAWRAWWSCGKVTEQPVLLTFDELCTLAKWYATGKTPVSETSRSIQALKEILLPHAEFDDGEGNKDASVLRGRLATIRDILRGTE
jgi:hypothetical protein